MTLQQLRYVTAVADTGTISRAVLLLVEESMEIGYLTHKQVQPGRFGKQYIEILKSYIHHVCRGNYHSTWASEGDYFTIAPFLLAQENMDAVIARIHEAEKYIPLDRLCLSSQCGFASCEIGNKLTELEQWNKLKLVKEIAETVWGK